MPLVRGSLFYDPTNIDYIFDLRPGDGTTTTSGTGAAGNNAGKAGYLEVKSLNTGTTGTGACGVRDYTFIPGAGEVYADYGVEIVDLATVAEDYILEVGIHNGTASAAITDGIYFRYNRSVSTNWYAITESSSTETPTDTSVAVAEDVPINLGIYINSDYTSVSFYINNALVATHTTNLSASADKQFYDFLVTKTAGTTSRRVFALYIQGVIKR